MAIGVQRTSGYTHSGVADLEATWAPRVRSVMRFFVALIYLEHATQGIWGFPPGGSGQPPLTSFVGVGLILQHIFGLFVLAGLFTRLFAFLLAGEMAVAYWVVHAPNGPYPLMNKGEMAAVYCFVFFYLFVSGGGSWSLDQLFFRRSRS